MIILIFLVLIAVKYLQINIAYEKRTTLMVTCNR